MQRVAFILYPGFQLIGLAAASVFEFANLTVEEPVYEILMVSEEGGLVQNSLGVAMQTERWDDTIYDTLFVTGYPEVPPGLQRIEAYLKSAAERTRRIASICTGAFTLARAGLLDGRRATTHWYYARDFRAAFPVVKMEEDRIFIIDGPIWTSAGMTAGIDLALAMVEKDLGGEIARLVAKKLVVYHRRAGGQSQYSALLELDPKSDRIQEALDYARQHLAAPLSVELLAEAARLSPRQFSRIFRAETGQSPAKAIEQLRVEAARLMMEQSNHSIDIIARETGFGDRERMRRAFLRAFGQSPRAMRRSLRIEPHAA